MSSKPAVSRGVLIVSGEASHGEKLAAAVLNCQLSPTLCGTLDQAQRILARERFAAILCEESSNARNFSSTLARMERFANRTPVIAVSRRDDWASCMVALNAGAADYVAFPPYAGEVERSLCKAAEATHLAGHLA
jgi:DNA-binding NtrC family response regulator